MDREDGMYRDYQTREELKLEIARLREAIDRHIELTGRDPSERIVELEDQLVMAGSSETFLNGEIARLREAIKLWAELDGPDGMRRCMNWDEYDKACVALHEIAREGR